jgi:hypothetical protein
MNYTHKLARRLARLRPAAVLAACGRWSSDRKIGHNRAVQHHPVCRTLPILTLVLLLAACADSSAPAAPDAGAVDMYQVGRGWTRRLVGIRISPDTAVVSPGRTVAFKASGVLTDGSSRPVAVSWAATGGTIDSAGVFTAGSTTGAYHVVGTEATLGIADTAAVVDATVSVDPPAPAVSSVSVSPSSATLAVGESVQLSAVAKDVDGTILTGSPISWSSSNPAVASVSSSGVVQALAAGSSVVAATIQGVQGKANVTVQATTGTVAGDCGSYPYDRLVSVSTASQLSSAIANAQSGDLIELAAGTYSGRWTITRSGTATSRIMLCGPRKAILNGGGISAGITLNLSGASYWTLKGFTATNSLKGVVVWGGRANVLDSLEVVQIGQEGIAVGRFSRANIIRNNSVHDTGKYAHQWGEGIYVGTSESNWCNFTNCQPDTSDSNQVVRNSVSATTSDGIQVMAGTTGVLVRGNMIDGAGMVSDPSSPVWVLAMGNDMLVDSNTGTHALTHGMKVRRNQSAWGNKNVFKANTMNVGTSGYAILLETSPAQGMIVKCDNAESNAGSGLSNIACTP